MNKKNWTSLMVAVRDLERSSRSFLAKSAQIAQRLGATLDVLHVFPVPYLQTSVDTWGISTSAIETSVKRETQQLENLVAPLRKLGIEIRCKVVWGSPIVESLLSEARKRKPNLLIIKTERHSRVGRWFLTNTDWELIRHCPCPLWIAKNAKLPNQLAALAAVDPFHTRDKPARLDREILEVAQRLAGKTGRVGACHAFEAPPTVVAALDESAILPPTPEEVRRYRLRAQRGLDKLIKTRRIAAKERFILEGEPAETLSKIVKRWKADVLVMGAVSRSAINRLFLGNTAERVLDAVDCDVVVVKL